MIRASFAAAALIACALPARADTAPAFPVFDLDGYCRTQARYSYAATLGDSSFEGVLATCQAREDDARTNAGANWPRVTPKAAEECIALADGKYSWLARCLDQPTAGRLTRR